MGVKVSERSAISREAEPFLNTCPKVNSIDSSDRRRMIDELDSRAREQVAKLVHNLLLMRNASDTRFVVVCATGHGEGCSWISSRTAEGLAGQLQGSVCLIDANLRSPSLHRSFGLQREPGFSDALVSFSPIKEYAKTASKLRDDNLWVIPCGSPNADPNTLLTSERLQLRFDQLRSAFDYVLIDAPPLSNYTDALTFARFSDGALMVMESNSTRLETARKCKEILIAAHVKLLGAVLNKRTFPVPEVLYRRF
jgi:capsular exopolysaccharide synthesis family protein